MNIEPLIKSYLKYTNHYLADCEIAHVVTDRSLYDETEMCYNVTIRNDCLACGQEFIEVNVTELLSYMWEVLHNVTGVTVP